MNGARCSSPQLSSWRQRLASEPLVVRVPDFARLTQPNSGRPRSRHREHNIGLLIVLVLVVSSAVLFGSPRLEPVRTALVRHLSAQQSQANATADGQGELMPILPVKPLVVRGVPRRGSELLATDRAESRAAAETGAALRSERVQRGEWR